MERHHLRDILPIIEDYEKESGSLIPVLHEVQKKIGYLPKDVQEFIAEELGVPFSQVYSVVTFYSFFSMEPKGDHTISVCTGTACYVKGADELVEELKDELDVEEGGTSDDKKFTLTTSRCVGACSKAPVMMIDDEVYGKLKPDELPDILNRY
ncbi:MAG: NADH-quinone oxidoreductase subunit NuoE [Thermoplasmata archaeon]